MDFGGLNKGKVISSVSRNYVGISGKGLTTFLKHMPRVRSKKKHTVRNANTEVFPQYSVRILENYKDISSFRYSKR